MIINNKEEYRIRYNTLSEMQIITHLQETGIVMDEKTLLEYVRKVMAFAQLTELWKTRKLIGLCACYMNDYKSLTAYITHIDISNELRHKGLGEVLISQVEICAKEKGFKNVELEVLKMNTIACGFYQKMGYTLKEDRGEKMLMHKNL